MVEGKVLIFLMIDPFQSPQNQFSRTVPFFTKRRNGMGKSANEWEKLYLTLTNFLIIIRDIRRIKFEFIGIREFFIIYGVNIFIIFKYFIIFKTFIVVIWGERAILI